MAGLKPKNIPIKRLTINPDKVGKKFQRLMSPVQLVPRIDCGLFLVKTAIAQTI